MVGHSDIDQVKAMALGMRETTSKRNRILISVIVPIFNVEAYLPKCLESLKQQTFPDVEFILVDDGSTDNSGMIADSYINDSRFRIFHNENNGLSAARNYGIDKARGNWLMFVDADDWVEANFCEKPYREAIRTGSDLVVFQFFSERHNRIRRRVRRDYPIGILSANTAINYYGYAAWNKLYRREIFDTIRYPEGMVYEDIATTHKLFCKAYRIAVIPDMLYCYVNRKSSISHTRSLQNKKDAFAASSQRLIYLMNRGYQSEKSQCMLQSAAIGLLASKCPHDEPDYQKAMEIVNSTKGIPRGLPYRKKLMLIAWRYSKPLFYLICRMTGRMKK